MQPITKFSDQELNVGKVLIMRQPHNMDDCELIRLSKAADITWLKDDMGVDIDEFVCDLLQGAYEAVTGNPYVSIYSVLGDDANSTFLKLTDHFGAALVLGSSQIKSLYTAELVRRTIVQVRHELEMALVFHNNLVNHSSKLGIDQASFISDTSAINNLHLTYADAELNRRLATIKSLMVDKW